MLHLKLYTFGISLFQSRIGITARDLLKRCELYSEGGDRGLNLIISCPDEKIAEALYECAEDLATTAYRLGLAKRIIVRVGSESLYSLPTDLLLRLSTSTIMSNQTLVLSDSDLRQEIDEHSSGAFLIRMKDHKGLVCNSSIIESSAANPNDWVGQDMSRFWDRSELLRFTNLLKKDKRLSEFTYNAYLFDDTYCEFCIDAKLVLWRGDECRLVKNLGCRPV